MAFTVLAARDAALSLVSVGLQNGSIKLIGSNTIKTNAISFGESDAAYLTTLITELAASLQKIGE